MSAQCVIEPLESRKLLTVVIEGEVMIVIGVPSFGDTISISRSGDDILATVNGFPEDPVPASSISVVAVRGLSGDDDLSVDGSLGEVRVGLFGQGGADTLTAGSDGAGLSGGAGPDTINGSDLRDYIFSGSGADEVNGNGGGDIIFGGRGNDVLNGNAGKDRIFGEGGDDSLDGGDGNDKLYGIADSDELTGGAGADTMFGGGGPDTFVDATDEDTVRQKEFSGIDALIEKLQDDAEELGLI